MSFNLILYNTIYVCIYIYIWLKRNTSSKLRVMVNDSLKTLKSVGFATLYSAATCARVKLRGMVNCPPSHFSMNPELS